MSSKLRIPRQALALLRFVLIGATAWVVAGQLSRLVADSLPLDNSIASPAYTSSATTQNRSMQHDYSALLRKNIFNADRTAINQESLSTDPSSITGDARNNTPKSSIAATLLGALIDPEQNIRLAIILLTENKEQKLYSTGDDLLGSSIIKIERNRVYLSRNGVTEVLEVDFADWNGTASKTGSGRKGITGSSANLTDVAKVGEGEYLVSRRYINAQLANMNRLITEVRAVPNIGKDGVTDGFRLFSIKQGSLFAKIGFQNRDVVKRINGMTIDSAEKGLELFSALRNETSFEVDLERNQQRISTRFSIQ